MIIRSGRTRIGNSSSRNAKFELTCRRSRIINLAFCTRVTIHPARLRRSCRHGCHLSCVTRTAPQMLLPSAIHKRAFGRDNGLRHAQLERCTVVVINYSLLIALALSMDDRWMHRRGPLPCGDLVRLSMQLQLDERGTYLLIFQSRISFSPVHLPRHVDDDYLLR